MMRGSGKEYAVALYALSAENACAEEICEGLAYARTVFHDTPELYGFLKTPAVEMGVREETLRNAFEGEVHEFVLSTLCTLCANGDIDALDECAEAFEALFDAERHIGHAVVTSAVELSADEKAALDLKLTRRFGRKLSYEYRLDPALLGGLVVETDGIRIDGSLRSRLSAMKGAMSE